MDFFICGYPCGSTLQIRLQFSVAVITVFCRQKWICSQNWSKEGKCPDSHVRDGKAKAEKQDDSLEESPVEEEWEWKSHLPKKELIQTTGNMGDDSAADDREVERQLKAGLKSGSMWERGAAFLKWCRKRPLYMCSWKGKQCLGWAWANLSENRDWAARSSPLGWSPAGQQARSRAACTQRGWIPASEQNTLDQ